MGAGPDEVHLGQVTELTLDGPRVDPRLCAARWCRHNDDRSGAVVAVEQLGQTGGILIGLDKLHLCPLPTLHHPSTQRQSRRSCLHPSVGDTPGDTLRSLAARRAGLVTLVDQVFEGGSRGMRGGSGMATVPLLTPGPGGPLTLAVECRTDPGR